MSAGRPRKPHTAYKSYRFHGREFIPCETPALDALGLRLLWRWKLLTDKPYPPRFHTLREAKAWASAEADKDARAYLADLKRREAQTLVGVMARHELREGAAAELGSSVTCKSCCGSGCRNESTDGGL